MIVKKPYAFLIKHFKAIHLLLFACLAFILYISSNLMNFVVQYSETGQFIYSALLPSEYIPLSVFFFCFLVVIIASIIDWLMQWKKKTRTYYIISIVFYSLLVAIFIIYRSFLSNILIVRLTDKTIFAYRDIIRIFTYPQYGFVLFTLFRAIGFDLKKFDFKKDIAELNIDAADSEEVEVVFKTNSYKYKRIIRKFFRDLRYNIIEYKYIYMIILAIIVAVISYFGYKSYKAKHDMMTEADYFSVNDIEFSVVKSYLSNIDYKGNVIEKGKYYVVVLVDMLNYSNYDTSLSISNFRLKAGNKIINADLNRSNRFIDLGKYYNNQTIYAGEEQEYYLVFTLSKEYLNEDFIFEVIDKNDKTKTFSVSISPIKLLEEKTNDYNIGDNISFEDIDLYETTLQVNSYELGSKFEDNYQYCLTDCYDLRKVYTTNLLNAKPGVILKLNISYSYPLHSYISMYLPSMKQFISTFGSIKYVENGKNVEKHIDANIVQNVNDDTLYVTLPDAINTSENIWLNLTIRNTEYNILLK